MASPNQKRTANKVMMYSNKITVQDPASSKIMDIQIHSEDKKCIISKTLNKELQINLVRAEKQHQNDTLKKHLKSDLGKLDSEEEFRFMEKLADRLFKYSVSMFDDPEEENKILFVEISLDDELSSQLLILNDNGRTDFRRINMETSDANAKQIEKVRNQVAQVQNILVNNVQKTLEERQARLDKLEENADAMSSFSMAFGDKAEQVKHQEQAKARCPCMFFPGMAWLIKKCPCLACVGCCGDSRADAKGQSAEARKREKTKQANENIKKKRVNKNIEKSSGKKQSAPRKQNKKRR